MGASITNALLLIAIHPIDEANRARLQNGLEQLIAEDPTLSFEADQATGDVVLGALSELQLEIVADRLRREFDVEASLGKPRVAYRETITQASDGEAKYARQSGGRGWYGHAKIHVRPGEPGTGCVFESVRIEGVIPNQFVGPIQQGIEEAATHGVLAGYPIQDLRVELYDGSYHDIDSSEMAFRIAGAMAFQDAARKAGPILLEPLMRIEVVVPQEHTADVIGNLVARGGEVQASDARGETHAVHALVPLSGLFGYSTDLRSLTLGRATYSLEFDRYQPVPNDTGTSGDDRHAPVPAPLKPVPRLKSSAVALPEPDDEPTHI